MLIIGHRGCHYDGYNQNTMRAYQKVTDEGVPAIEIDVQLTKDNELVVIHNLNLEKVSTGTGFVRHKTLAELKTIYAGDITRGKDLIPEFKEVLEFLSKQIKHRPVLHVELKGDDTGLPTGKLIKSYIDSQKLKLSDVFISSFNWKELQNIRTILPTVEIGLLDGSIHRKELKQYIKNPDALFAKIFSYGEEDYMLPHTINIEECERLYNSEIADENTRTIIQNEVKKALSGGYYTDNLIQTALEYKAYSLNLWHETLNKNFVEKAHKKGLKVFVYTVNKPKDLEKLFDLNVDGFFTDFYTQSKAFIESYLKKHTNKE